MGEEKIPEEGDARDRWIEKSAVLYDLILQSVNNGMFQHIKDLIKDTYGRMAAAGSNVSQIQQCTKIISVLDKLWDNLIPTLNTQQDQWTPEWLRQQILQEDFRRRHTGGGAANKTAEGYGAAGGSRGRGGGRGQGPGRIFGRGRGQDDYNEGHGSSDGRGSTRMEGVCWLGAQGDGAHGKADLGMFLMVEDVKGSEGDVGLVGKVVMHPLTHWVIDSGCTSPMTPRADLLDQVNPPVKIKFVAAASDALLPVIGVGNVKVMGANRRPVGLGNVLLVEGWSANLLSVRRLQKSKAKVTFGPTSCRAKLGKLMLWDLEEKNSCIKDLWLLPIIPWNGKPPATAAAAATAKATAGGEETVPTDGALDAVKKVQQTQQPHGEVLAGVDATAAWAKASSGSGEADYETWHERLCHVNFPMLQKLVKDGSLKGLEVKGSAKEIGSYPTCLETKFTKFPFSSSTGPTKAPLVLVHMDVVGPTRAPSLSGSCYFLTILDDHTRAAGEVPAGVLKEWMPRAQRESGHKNIVAERFNRTLQEGAHTLLGRAGLPDPFWVTALRQVALVKNRVLVTVGDKQWVPYTKWYGSAPAVNMFRAYGCMVVFHVPKEKRGKLEASGRWGVHLGLDKDDKGWSGSSSSSPFTTTPLIIEDDEVQRPSRQVQVTVSEEEISGVTEDGGEPEVEEQQQQQDAPPQTQHPRDRPRRDVPPPNRLTYPSFGKPKVVRNWSVAEKCDEDEIAHCYWEAVPEPKTLAEALSRPNAEKWKHSVKEEYDSLLENEAWELCELPPGKKAISSKLIFRHKIKQMDITTAFLNGIILEELYMLQPEGLDDGSNRVCKLKKAIYGLKHGPRAWYHKLEETLLAGGFKKSECDHSLFLLQEKEQFLMLLVYVDDTRLFSESSAMIERVEETLEMQFNAVRQRRQRGAADLGKGEMLLTCYTDASFSSLKADGTSIGGYVCLFGGGVVSWCSKNQNEVGLSSCETEYMALHHGVKEVVWLRRLLEEIGVCQREPKIMFCDNESAVKLAKNACLDGLTKHIRPKWHWVRRLLDKEVQLEIVKT
ncbi:unnamed protein product [Closterium sp. NIES-54]